MARDAAARKKRRPIIDEVAILFFGRDSRVEKKRLRLEVYQPCYCMELSLWQDFDSLMWMFGFWIVKIMSSFDTIFCVE